MSLLVIGSTGLAGQAIMQEAHRRGLNPVGAARRNADIALDVTDLRQLDNVLCKLAPAIVINCAALVSVEACDKDPGLGWQINARPASLLAEWSAASGGKLIQISTDHYFTTGGSKPHAETDPVCFVNEYARQKFAAEAFALSAPDALVLRTSILGLRGWPEPTFAEWALDMVRKDAPATLFADAWTSSIDVGSFARALFDLQQCGARGLINLAASEVYSKEAFVRALAARLGRRLTKASTGSIASLGVRRANCLGLDVSRAETILGYRLPGLQAIIRAILEPHEEAMRHAL